MEKHRLLITVGSQFQSLDLGAHRVAMLRHAAAEPNRHMLPKDILDLSAFFKPKSSAIQIAAGTELFIDAPDAEPNPEMQFRFNVPLHELLRRRTAADRRGTSAVLHGCGRCRSGAGTAPVG